ncbi:MAG: hypothetical protein ACPLKV_00970 [Minisyncoccia bacterium]
MSEREIILLLSREIAFLETEVQRLELQRSLLSKQEFWGAELSRLRWMQDLYEINEKIANLKQRQDELKKRRFFVLRDFIEKIERRQNEKK